MIIHIYYMVHMHTYAPHVCTRETARVQCLSRNRLKKPHTKLKALAVWPDDDDDDDDTCTINANLRRTQFRLTDQPLQQRRRDAPRVRRSVRVGHRRQCGAEAQCRDEQMARCVCVCDICRGALDRFVGGFCAMSHVSES